MPDSVWLAAKARGEAEGVPLTEVVVAALAEYGGVEVPEKNRGGRRPRAAKEESE